VESGNIIRILMAAMRKREALAAREDSWLASGADDQYGLDSYFIATNYSDDEKQSLWDKRGDHERWSWKPGMRRPEPITTERQPV
jgi:hypothetical protein